LVFTEKNGVILPVDAPVEHQPNLIFALSENAGQYARRLGLWEEHTAEYLTARQTKIELCNGNYFMTFSVPERSGNTGLFKFSLCLAREDVVFVARNQETLAQLQALIAPEERKNLSAEELLTTVLSWLLVSDMDYLEKMEVKITHLEGQALKGDVSHFDLQMAQLRRQLLHLHSYYERMQNICGRLVEDENDFFSEQARRRIGYFLGVSERLYSHVRMLREYSVQVREIYQTQLDLRQNEVMRVLTVVTAIFLPLTLIVGWYGMNFTGMPELHWKYGYPVVILVSVLVVLFLIRYFRRKKYL